MNGSKSAFTLPMPAGTHPEDDDTQYGLTKREYMVIEFAKAILTGNWANGDREIKSDTDIVKWAVDLADEVLKQI